MRGSPRHEGEAGPFDVIGDNHGCVETVRALLARLGYESVDRWVHRHSKGCRGLFLDDYIDWGRRAPEHCGWCTQTAKQEVVLAIAGNHEEVPLWTLILDAAVEDYVSGHWLSTRSPASNVAACWPWSVTMSASLALSFRCSSREMIEPFEPPVECIEATPKVLAASATNTPEHAGD